MKTVKCQGFGLCPFNPKTTDCDKLALNGMCLAQSYVDKDKSDAEIINSVDWDKYNNRFAVQTPEATVDVTNVVEYTEQKGKTAEEIFNENPSLLTESAREMMMKIKAIKAYASGQVDSVIQDCIEEIEYLIDHSGLDSDALIAAQEILKKHMK